MLVFILSSDVFHSSSSRPLSVANSVDGDHRQSPSGLTRKGHGYMLSRSRSPPKFTSSRSPAALNGHSKDQRNDKFFGKSDIHPENFPNARSHNSGTSNHSGYSTERTGHCNRGASTEPGHRRLDSFRPPAGNREPASNDVRAHGRLTTDPSFFTELGCRRDVAVHPFEADIYRPFPHRSPLPPVCFPSPLVGSSNSPPSPISAAKNNNRVVWHNGWSNSITSSTGLIDIPSDNGLVLW